MPLKHSTETVLIVVLGLLVLVTGAVLSMLPALPEGTVLWGVAWALSIAYPLLLYPTLKERRADNSFRVLHFVPMGMLFLWLVLEIASFYYPDIEVVSRWYTWGWSAGVVIVGLSALVIFSGHVLRQRNLRMVLLGMLFVPMAVLGVGGEFTGIRSQLAGALSDIALVANVLKIAPGESEEEVDDGQNLVASADQEEEAWRMRLRRMERRQDRIVVASSSRRSEPPLIREPQKDVLITRDTLVDYGDKTEPPPNLASSGVMGGMDILGVMMIAGYCGMVHRRLKRS